MRRPTPPGTPSRSSRYLIPFDSRRLVRRSLAVAGAVLVVGVGLYVAGVHRLASPGNLAAAHGAIDVQCTQCHQPAKQVIDLRCERCHDPIDSRRFEGPAHAVRAGARATRTAHEPALDCAVCHADHGGRRRDLRQVDDTRCASCHTFASMRSHPEFALVRAARDAGAGLDFSHEIHLREVAKIGGDRCLSCHTPTPDQRAFEPFAFDTHCAKCHVLNGALTLNGTDLLKSGWTPATVLPPARSSSSPSRGPADERGRVTLERFSHRDPWTIAAAERLTRTIAGGAFAASVYRREADIARLAALTRAVPLTALADTDLAAWLPLVDRDVAALERAAGAGPAALSDPTVGLEAFAGLDPSIAAVLAQVRGVRAPRAGANLGSPTDPQTLEDRRREIAGLLVAVSARAAGPATARAAALQKRLADVKASAPAAAPPDTAAIHERLDSIEGTVRTLEPAAAATDAAEIRDMSDRIRQQLSGGADASAMATARGRLLDLLNAMETRASTPLRARISDLRDTVSTVTAADGLGRLRDRKDRLRDRIAIERALRAEHGPVTVDATVNRERSVAARELQSRRARDVGMAAPVVPPVDLEPSRAKAALKGLLGACLACHRLDEDEAALRPLSSARSILTAAIFSHKPHTNQAACDTCHAVAKSRAGVDVNLPSVKSCETCHDAARARADCVSCHTYHPQSAAELVQVSR